MRTKWLSSLVTAFLVFCCLSLTASACTNITVRTKSGDIIRGRTLELGGDLESQMLVIPKGSALSGYGPKGDLDGMKWTATYSAAGLNGLNLPIIVDGLNDQGLSGGMLMFPTFAQSQTFDAAKLDKTISAEQVLTWALTQFATVEEVRAALPDIQVIDVALPDVPAFPVHFIFTDRSGKSIVVEYTDGNLNIYDNPLGVLTNSPPFPWHEINLRNYVNLTITNVPPVKLDGLELAPLGSGDSLHGMPGDFTPPSRFIRATIYSQALPELDSAEEAVLETFHVMNQFDIPPGLVPGNPVTSSPGEELLQEQTQWTIVIDQSNLKLYVTTLQDRGIQVFDLGSIDESKGIQTFPLATETTFTPIG
ncbi:MAG: choloylglycine hydrolase family protein [Thermomicrobiales bacterium]